MKNIYRICFVLILPLIWVGCKKDKPIKPVVTSPGATVYKAPANFRVVGYLLSEEIADGEANSFAMNRLNYLNITVGDTSGDGTIGDITNFTAIITAAHAANVKVLVSVGNDFIAKHFYANETSRTTFISNLMASVDQYQLDGVDVDLEGDYINKNYEVFVSELSVAIKAKDKLLTAAIATWESDSFTDKSLTYYDYLNVMSYDDTGPWAPRDPGPHSPYSMAVDDYNYWTNTRGIAKEKINIGLPFYGYAFAEKGPASTLTFKQILNKFPDSYKTDSLTEPNGDELYYNGIPTIKQKTTFAMQNAGGVMFWELMQDATNDKSLLNAIDQTANPDNN